MENKSSDIEASSSQPIPQVRTSSFSTGSAADDAASTSTPRPAPSSSTEATVGNNSSANPAPYQKRNSLGAVPTRTSSKNGPSPDTPGNLLPDGSSNARKRRKRRDGDSSSVNTGHSTTEGRTHKPHHGGGISKFFSVFLNCCRAPDTSGDAPRKAAQKPQSKSGTRSTPEVPGQKNLSLQGSGTDSESKEEEKKPQIQPDGDVQMITPSINSHVPVVSEKQALLGEKLFIEKPTLSEESSDVPKAPEPARVDAPMAVVDDYEAIRPSTSSPVPQPILGPTKEDVTMAEIEAEVIKTKAPVVKTELPSIPAPEEEEPVEIKPAVEDHTPAADEKTQDPTVEVQPVEQKQWLLPPLKPEMQGKKCLVLDLDETLVHSSFKLIHQADFTIPVEIEGAYHNVYVIKRPGVDQFMKRVGELYEVVVFTASVSKYGDPLLDQLDINHVVHHRLFRESCFNHQGNYVKDLSQLGRDLKDTIIIDNSPTSYIFHPQHAVPISSWFSDAHDNELLDLIPVLEDLSGVGVRDVSMVLDVSM